MQTQARIAQELNIDRTLVKGGEPQEIQRRIDFIKTTLRQSGCKALVLGISGGVDSLTAGRLCQLACEQLRSEGYAARFIAMRLPYNTQADEGDAQASLVFITPDQIDTLNIAASVDGLMASLTASEASAAHVDFIKGNVKARARMVAQYAVANLHNGLVVGTDHGAEALMGFFTKFGDVRNRYEERRIDPSRPLLPPAELFLPVEDCFAQLFKLGQQVVVMLGFCLEKQLHQRLQSLAPLLWQRRFREFLIGS